MFLVFLADCLLPADLFFCVYLFYLRAVINTVVPLIPQIDADCLFPVIIRAICWRYILCCFPLIPHIAADCYLSAVIRAICGRFYFKSTNLIFLPMLPVFGSLARQSLIRQYVPLCFRTSSFWQPSHLTITFCSPKRVFSVISTLSLQL